MTLELDKAISLIDSIKVSDRPLWVANLVDKLGSVVQLPEISIQVINVGRDDTRWSMAKELFIKIRSLTLKVDSPIEEGKLCLLENSAKTIYNSCDNAVSYTHLTLPTKA